MLHNVRVCTVPLAPIRQASDLLPALERVLEPLVQAWPVILAFTGHVKRTCACLLQTLSQSKYMRCSHSAAPTGCLILALLTLAACARVESVDQFGNRKTGWFLASSFDWGDDNTTRVINVRGIGLNRIGNSWALGAHKTQVVAIASDCQVVVLNDREKFASRAALPVRAGELCLQSKRK